MSLIVKVNTTPSVQTNISTEATQVNTRLNKIDFALVNLEQLNNVAEEVNGLEDGYTIVYDAAEKRWVTQPVGGIIDNIDGGTY